MNGLRKKCFMCHTGRLVTRGVLRGVVLNSDRVCSLLSDDTRLGGK